MHYSYLSKSVSSKKCVNALKHIALFDSELVWSLFFILSIQKFMKSISQMWELYTLIMIMSSVL